jgi:hypothetical protein
MPGSCECPQLSKQSYQTTIGQLQHLARHGDQYGLGTWLASKLVALSGGPSCFLQGCCFWAVQRAACCSKLLATRLRAYNAQHS